MSGGGGVRGSYKKMLNIISGRESVSYRAVNSRLIMDKKSIHLIKIFSSNGVNSLQNRNQTHTHTKNNQRSIKRFLGWPSISIIHPNLCSLTHSLTHYRYPQDVTTFELKTKKGQEKDGTAKGQEIDSKRILFYPFSILFLSLFNPFAIRFFFYPFSVFSSG